MNVFVTGGTGEIGRPALAALVASGHVVQVSSRSDANDRMILSLGAIPLRTELLDRLSVQAAVNDADAILHLATRIPPPAEMGDISAWLENDRLRRETTEYLVDAAREHEVSVVVLQSYFAVRAPGGEDWIRDDPAARQQSWSDIEVMESARDAELTMRKLESTDTRAVILRFGSLYSETSDQLQAQVSALQAGAAVVPGDGTNYWPFIASGDAGRAVAQALTIPSGTYHVADDEPVQMRAFWRMAASAVGVSEPPVGGGPTGPMAEMLLGSWRLANAPFRTAAHWEPEIASVETGWPRAAARFLSRAPATAAHG